MRIGITGQEGFIGSSVSRSLSAEGHEILSLDKYTRLCAKDDFALEGIGQLDWILHFASSTSIEGSFADPFYTYANNIESTLLALKIAYSGRSAFLFMSSYVYGQPKYLPVDEKHPVAYTNPYMASKIICEELCGQLSTTLGIPLVILRGSSIYGDFRIPGRLISDILEAIRNGEAIRLNDPAPKRDYLYIKDLCSLVQKIISKKPVAAGVYNAGYGQAYSNMEAAKIAVSLSGSKRDVIVNSAPRHKDINDCSIDANLVKKTFSWTPLYPLEKGLAELIKSNPRKD